LILREKNYTFKPHMQEEKTDPFRTTPTSKNSDLSISDPI